MGLLATSFADPLLNGGGIIPPGILVSFATTQRLSVTYGSSGGPISSYANYLTNVQGRFNPLKGTEVGSQGRLNSEVMGKFYCNGSPDIIATDRLVFNNRVFDIKDVRNNDEIGAFLTLDIIEVLPSGVGA